LSAIVIADLRCDECGSDQPMAFRPGTEEDRGDLFLITRGVPVRCICMKCWGREANNAAIG